MNSDQVAEHILSLSKDIGKVAASQQGLVAQMAALQDDVTRLSTSIGDVNSYVHRRAHDTLNEIQKVVGSLAETKRDVAETVKHVDTQAVEIASIKSSVDSVLKTLSDGKLGTKMLLIGVGLGGGGAGALVSSFLKKMGWAG